MRKIKLNEVKEGDKLEIVKYYSSYGSNEQEESFLVDVKQTEKGLKLFKEDGSPFYHGANSSYEYYLTP